MKCSERVLKKLHRPSVSSAAGHCLGIAQNCTVTPAGRKEGEKRGGGGFVPSIKKETAKGEKKVGFSPDLLHSYLFFFSFPLFPGGRATPMCQDVGPSCHTEPASPSPRRYTVVQHDGEEGTRGIEPKDVLKWAWEKRGRGRRDIDPEKKPMCAAMARLRRSPPPLLYKTNGPFFIPHFRGKGPRKDFFTKLLRLHLFFTGT